MEISVDLIFDAAAIIAVFISGITAWKTSSRQNKQEKDILTMQHNHELSSARIQNLEKRDTQYEDHRYNAITSYLQKAGTFLFDPDSKEAASEFGKSVGEIFMYIPNEKKELVKGLNSLIADIITAPVDNDDGSCEHRTQLIDQATDIYYMLCEKFSDLGVKKPSAIDN